MISSTTIQLHAPNGLKANRNGEYKEASVKKNNYLYLFLFFPDIHKLVSNYPGKRDKYDTISEIFLFPSTKISFHLVNLVKRPKCLTEICGDVVSDKSRDFLGN